MNFSLKRSRSAIEPSEERYTRRRKPNMPLLETVPDDLDEGQHASFDEAVCKLYDDQPSSLNRTTYLLATIVSTSNGLLDPKYGDISNARVLLEKHSELMDQLGYAWKAGKFKDIRNLSAISTSLIVDLHRTKVFI
jgi:hypothetical protein